MIKKISTLLSVILLLGILTGTTYANETLNYEGTTVDKSTLSSDTIEWLEWYNALSPGEQDCINYVPYELRKQSRTGVTVEEASPESGIRNALRANLLPLSGGEAAYDPSYWNHSSRIKKANCYAYAMDVICATDMKLQPGELAGSTWTALTASNIINAAKKDGPYLGNGRTLVTTNANSTSTNKSYKVALVLGSNDYHWYVQNSDGYWSHKPGQTNATDVDASGNYITDPKTCNRAYSYENYSTWGGYLMVTRK
ncbi:hypothetical protein [Lacrimispora sp.]|uniref:hypothetical protein n=1 Tax=Lacrimispora sp. TaxID=2719234 RepID=UPI00345F1C5F